MKTFNDHLNNKLKDKEFIELYEEEKLLLQLSNRIFEEKESRAHSISTRQQSTNYTTTTF